MADIKQFIPLTVRERENFQAIPAWVTEAGKRLRQSGFQAYLVGGAVRDLLTGKTPHDWDLATNALPDQVEAIFPLTVPTGKKYGTVTITGNGHSIEITTLREDLAYSDGRRPDLVRFTKEITADLARRDFTINAMAYDLGTQTLIDPFGGKHDLRRRVLKAVGDPKIRFKEDGLRMFRFYRFLATLDLRPEQATIKAINPQWAVPVSKERVGAELHKMLVGTAAVKGLEGLQDSGLLELVIPELGREELESGDSRKKPLWQHLCATVAAIRPQLHLRWAALLHDIGKPLTKKIGPDGLHFYGHAETGAKISRLILERFHYPNSLINQVVKLISLHMFTLGFPYSDAAIRRLIAKTGTTVIGDLLELRRADIVATGQITSATWEYWQDLTQRINAVLDEANVYQVNQLALNGYDLMNGLQLPPGPKIGQILRFLLEQVLEDPGLNRKDILLRLAREYQKTDES